MKTLEAALKNKKFTRDERTMLFRLKRSSESYERNIENRNDGRTDFWRVSENNLYPGQTIVLLMDHPDKENVIKVFAGVYREYESHDDGTKTLWTEAPFAEIAQTSAIGINDFVGKHIAPGVIYPFTPHFLV